MTPDQQAQQRRMVLGAAMGVLAVRGYDRVRLKDVAEASNVSIGTLQHYFGTRDELMQEVLQVGAQERLAAWLANADASLTAGEDPWLQMQRLLRLTVAEAEFGVPSPWVEFSAAAARHPELRPLMHEVYDAWREPIRRTIALGIDAGRFAPEVDAEAVITVITCHIDGYLMARSLAIEGIDAERLRPAMISAVAGMLRVAA